MNTQIKDNSGIEAEYVKRFGGKPGARSFEATITGDIGGSIFKPGDKLVVDPDAEARLGDFAIFKIGIREGKPIYVFGQMKTDHPGSLAGRVVEHRVNDQDRYKAR